MKHTKFTEGIAPLRKVTPWCKITPGSDSCSCSPENTQQCHDHRVTFGKKAQSELLGFVMVVFLVAVGMLFVVGFVLISAKNDVRIDFEDKQLAINLNDALLEFSSECRNIKVKDLLKDCAQDKYLRCDDKDACGYLQDKVLPEFFNATLEEWGKLFYYEAYIVQGDVDFQLIEYGSKSECRYAEVTPGVFYLPLRSGRTVFSELQLCRDISSNRQAAE